MIITLRRIYNSNMVANESVFLRSIRDVVGEVLRDLRASVSKRAFIAFIDRLLDGHRGRPRLRSGIGVK